MITLCVDKAYWLSKSLLSANNNRQWDHCFSHWDTGRYCVCVCFEKSFIGRQSAGRIESLMLVLMSQWKCLHSVIYKLHLPCLALLGCAPYCCLVRQRKWPKRDGINKIAVSFSCFSFLSLFLYIFHVWYKMSQGILVD